MLGDEKLFNAYWHLVGHRNELSNPGDFIKFDTPSGDAVIFNDMGNLVAFDNRCAHRGTTIYNADHGNMQPICPYHGWAYRNGKLVIPKKESFTGCDIENADLKKFRLDFVGDFVFLAVDPIQSLSQQVSSLAVLLEKISTSIDSRYDFNRYQFECYWPLAMENALEPYHIPKIHPKTLATLKLGDGNNEITGPNSIWYASINDEKINKSLKSFERFYSLDHQHEGYMSIYLFPFTMLSSTYGYSYSLQNFIPPRATRKHTHFTSRLFVSKTVSGSAAEVMASFFESSSALNRKVFEEDHEICKRMPEDSWSTEPLKFASQSEEKIQHFRKTLKSFMAS